MSLRPIHKQARDQPGRRPRRTAPSRPAPATRRRRLGRRVRSGGTSHGGAGSNDEAGDTVTIGFSAPAADHGWMAAITKPPRKARPRQYADVELKVAEGTNDVNLQISQVETFINDGVDAIVLLPFDGAATHRRRPQGDGGRHPGHQRRPRVRRPRSPPASPVLGDNYGMGVSAGTYICEQLGGQRRTPIIAEIAGIDSLPLTQDRSQGFADALDDVRPRRSPTASPPTSPSRAASRPRPTCCRPRRKIDALWNHDDDQGVGVLAAIESAGRDEFFMVGGAGSANAMRDIQADDTRAQGDRHLPARRRASTASSWPA